MIIDKIQKTGQKELKTELPAASVIKDKVDKTGKTSLKSQEVSMKTGENKKKMSQTEGCVNKDGAEWYQGNVNDVFNQLNNALLQGNQLYTLIKKFMTEIHKSMQHIKLQPEIVLTEIQDIVNMVADN